jgi:hypothetical protein
MDWKIVSTGPGACQVVGVTRRQAPVDLATTTLRAIERRGWLKVSPWREDGVRTAKITAAGTGALDD